MHNVYTIKIDKKTIVNSDSPVDSTVESTIDALIDIFNDPDKINDFSFEIQALINGYYYSSLYSDVINFLAHKLFEEPKHFILDKYFRDCDDKGLIKDEATKILFILWLRFIFEDDEYGSASDEFIVCLQDLNLVNSKTIASIKVFLEPDSFINNEYDLLKNGTTSSLQLFNYDFIEKIHLKSIWSAGYLFPLMALELFKTDCSVKGFNNYPCWVIKAA